MKFESLVVVLGVFLLHPSWGFLSHTGWTSRQRHLSRESCLFYESSSPNNQDCSGSNVDGLAFVSPVLLKLYPALLSFKEKYGHVDIPLGSSEGRKCDTLRRLQVQGKLAESDVAVLNELGFRWHSLEDVYHTADFGELLHRLKEYAKRNQGDVSPPKKYELDPELGAWVTGIRRLGRDGVESSHAAALDEIGFSWTSKRKCGSAFMNQYREMKQLKEALGESFADDVKVQLWIRAQQDAASRGALSETRMHYMEQLVPGWQQLALQ